MPAAPGGAGRSPAPSSSSSGTPAQPARCWPGRSAARPAAGVARPPGPSARDRPTGPRRTREIARSKQASGRGTFSALPWMSGNSMPNSAWSCRAMAQLAGRLSSRRVGRRGGPAMRTRSRCRSPAPRDHAVEVVGQEVDIALGDREDAPRRPPTSCAGLAPPTPATRDPKPHGCAGRAPAVRPRGSGPARSRAWAECTVPERMPRRPGMTPEPSRVTSVVREMSGRYPAGGRR